MSSQSYLQELFDSSRWPILALLATIIVLEYVALMKVHPRYFDRSALVFLSMITICLASKSVSLILKAVRQSDAEIGIEFPPLDILNMATETAFWVLLDFFVLEMLTVRHYIESANSKEFDRQMKRQRKLRYILLPILVFCSLVFKVLISLKITSNSIY